ncbi:MAG TPA: glycosyltransferase family 39 protein [Candidatus Acidoferrum sp.]|nr:glycosyltransferase family 39 protein [Candidatus Acidoferrum sp.]
MVSLRQVFQLDFHPRKDLYDHAFMYLFVISAALRLIWLDKPTGLLIFDETYYVNVARIILKLPQQPNVYPNAIPGIDSVNQEHPLLAKLLIALSIHTIGDNGWGWRIPSVIFGLLSIFVLYLLLKKTAKNSLIALMGTFLFSFDTLVFVHSRIATLDIFVLGFMLLGFYWYFSNRMNLSALAMALSTLCKISGIYGVLTLAAFHLGRELLSRGRKVDWQGILAFFEKYAIVYLGSFIVLLTVLDFFWAGYKNPFEHLSHIYDYTFALRAPDVRKPNDIWSYPWEWLIDQVRIHYATVNVTVYTDHTVARTYPTVDFIGAMNPTIVFLTIPAMVYTAYRYYETRSEFALFVLAWFSMTYLPYIPAAVFGHRIMYIFYFLNTVPAVAASVAGMIVDQAPPRIVVVFYIAAVIAAFYMMFPFKVIP